jgi:hypothetical protein
MEIKRSFPSFTYFTVPFIPNRVKTDSHNVFAEEKSF